MRTASFILCLTIMPLAVAPAETTTSPDGSLAITVNVSGPPTYQITVNGKPVVAASRLGLEFKDGPKLGEKSRLLAATRRPHDQTWEYPFGKSSKVRDHFNETRLQLGGCDVEL